MILSHHRLLPRPQPFHHSSSSRTSRRWISDYDYAQLQTLLSDPHRDARAEWSYTRLREILQQARIVPASQLPPGTVQIGSSCSIHGRRLDQAMRFVVTLPAEASPGERRVSVLSPLGLAVLGRQQGQHCEVLLAGGLQHFRLTRVSYRLLHAWSPEEPRRISRGEPERERAPTPAAESAVLVEA